MPVVRSETHFPDGEVVSRTGRMSGRELNNVVESFCNIFGAIDDGSIELLLVLQRHKWTGKSRWVPVFAACRSGYRVGFRLNEDGGFVAAFMEAD